MSDSRKPLFKLVISGIKLTFVDNFGLNADYLVHLNRKRKDVGGSREAYPEGKDFKKHSKTCANFPKILKVSWEMRLYTLPTIPHN